MAVGRRFAVAFRFLLPGQKEGHIVHHVFLQFIQELENFRLILVILTDQVKTVFYHESGQFTGQLLDFLLLGVVDPVDFPHGCLDFFLEGLNGLFDAGPLLIGEAFKFLFGIGRFPVHGDGLVA